MKTITVKRKQYTKSENYNALKNALVIINETHADDALVNDHCFNIHKRSRKNQYNFDLFIATKDAVNNANSIDMNAALKAELFEVIEKMIAANIDKLVYQATSSTSNVTEEYKLKIADKANAKRKAINAAKRKADKIQALELELNKLKA